MFESQYFHGTVRRYIVLFGTLFNEIYIKRYDNNGNQINSFKVPLTYEEKDKMIARNNQDPNIDRAAAVVWPYMSFNLNSITYDADRKLLTIGRAPYISADAQYANYVYNPVPYNFDFELNIATKTVEDGHKIVEQILPYFTPDWTVTIRIIDDPVVVTDVPTILNSTKPYDNYNGQFPDRRYIIWTLNFTMKGNLYGPVNKSKIIKKAISNIYTNSNSQLSMANSVASATVIDERITVQPGLTSNGKPTSNLAQSVDYSIINWDDDFGYIVTTETYPRANTY